MNCQKFAIFSLMTLLALNLGACAAKNKTEVVGENKNESQMEKAASDRGDHVVSRLMFNKGQSTLTDGARSELVKAITEAQKRGPIRDVTVTVWSDMEYPGENRKLPDAQVALAGNRGNEIEDFLKKELRLSGRSVRVHNMGKKPGFMADFLKTSDEEVKNQLTAQGMAPTEESQIDGASSSALIFIKLR